MSKLDKKFFGENATADNWNNTDGAVIKVEYDQGNSITLPKHKDEPEEVVSTSFSLDVLPDETENVAEKLAAKVMLANQEALLTELGLDTSNYKISAEEVAQYKNSEDGSVITEEEYNALKGDEKKQYTQIEYKEVVVKIADIEEENSTEA